MRLSAAKFGSENKTAACAVLRSKIGSDWGWDLLLSCCARIDALREGKSWRESTDRIMESQGSAFSGMKPGDELRWGEKAAGKW